ncbi:hypothetical protein [Flavisolibacter tropicus]|uniref:Uncharacterized protein n=1 Tax=Flavisolibacter tropicus TaxID=1492898 RepID=A0A172TQZ9_9BACT|nr:hypothetical protein [Flavisolibacter tropicus]ANE49501.1 hypothetical protein SY85_02290 [Flavisolibacter tropicus]
MPGRGDNNKKGSSGRGSSNQSNQPFVGQEKVQKSNHGREQTGGQRSQPATRQQDQDSNRNTSTEGKEVRRS